MKQPRNRSKPRPTRKAARLAAEKTNAPAPPQGDSLVGRASSPSPPPSPPSPSLPEDQTTDLLLRLWEDGSLALSDIADALSLSVPGLLKLLRQPDTAELLDQMGQLLDLRLKHIAAKAAPKALATLEAVQTEAELEATRTPVSPVAIKADREARTKRTQRRLAAAAILTCHRSLITAQMSPLKLTHPSEPSEAMLDRGGMAMQSMAMRTTPQQPMQQSA